MDELDFNRLREIADELDIIRKRNNLTELQLRADNDGRFFANSVMLLTREEYKDDFNHYQEKCRIAYTRYNKLTNEDEEMSYDDYINYK
jgi:hypothetical protein